MDTNFVLAGKYEGSKIKTDDTEKVYIVYEDGIILNLRLYFDKTNVISVEKLNEESSSFKTSASYWLGSVAAAGLSDVKDVILKISWRDNTESMIKVREGIYTQILATSMSEMPDVYHLKNEEERKKFEQEHQPLKSSQNTPQASNTTINRVTAEGSKDKDSTKRSIKDSFLIFIYGKDEWKKRKEKKTNKTSNSINKTVIDKTFSFKEFPYLNTLSIRSINTSIEGKIVIPSTYDGKTVTTISDNGFAYCKKIKAVVVPVSISTFGDNAFAECSQLTEFFYEGTKIEWIAITKGQSWDVKTHTYVIHCTDGDLSK